MGTTSSIPTFTEYGCWKEEREKGLENLFEKIMTESLPNLVKEIDIQVLEVQRAPNRMKLQCHTPRHVISEMPKFLDKEKILKAAREKQLIT